ncbi:MAG: reductive dehalogenase domain-containing protein [Spirochaetales bacterium]|uniref:Reductive dehalogenase domain-containing protein n=1 Tax=Candidatus Thalassospirochaeta sargassi TaxID=3119039 RepID=A0AAJ1IBI7_9SPIO|nr:reductive dehalogenase domain-containing protein [Spirochaetales bacterium]
MIKPKYPDLRNYIDPDTPTVKSDETSHEGYFVPEIIFTYGQPKSIIKKILTLLPTILDTLRNVFKSYKSIRRNPGEASQLPGDGLFDDFKTLAIKLHCSSVGFTEIPTDMIFRNREILYKYAFVMTMEMRREAISRAPGRVAAGEVWRTYHELGRVVNRLAGFLRDRGYNAQAGPSLGGDTNYVRLAQKAGMGWTGRHGLLISPENGPCQRIAVVYTDISLPFTDSVDHAWIESFCSSCGRCVKKCPGNAIYQEYKKLDEGGRQYIDYKKCAVPFSQTLGCSVCIRECTFTKGSYDKIKAAFNAKAQG